VIYFPGVTEIKNVIIHLINEGSLEILGHSGPYSAENEGFESMVNDLFKNFIDKYFTKKDHALSDNDNEAASVESSLKRRRTGLATLFKISMITDRIVELLLLNNNNNNTSKV